jgi:hypothetical protein
MRLIGLVALLGMLFIALMGCGSGQRADIPEKGSEAATALEKGIPTKTTEQGSKPAPTPQATP